MDKIRITNGKIVLIFSSLGCLNCQMLATMLQEFIAQYPNIKFQDINADKATDLVKKYQITSLPTLLFFKNGKITARCVGCKPKKVLQQMLNDFNSSF